MQTSLMIDADEIETKMIGLQIMPSDQRLSGPQGPIEFVAVDAGQCFGARKPTPHFDDQERPPAAGDDVEFATATDPITGRDAPAAPLQMEAGLGFGSKTLSSDRPGIHAHTVLGGARNPTQGSTGRELQAGNDEPLAKPGVSGSNPLGLATYLAAATSLTRSSLTLVALPTRSRR